MSTPPRRFAGSPIALLSKPRSPSRTAASVPDGVTAAFERLPEVMNRADARASQVDAAVLELAEAVVLSGQVGETFDGTVTDIDQRGARIQLKDPAVITRVPVNGLEIGASTRLRLEEADPARRLTRFSLA